MNPHGAQNFFNCASTHGLPMAFVLAGAYIGTELSKDTLVALHRHTLTSAARKLPG
jgi:hypothetical protein